MMKTNVVAFRNGDSDKNNVTKKKNDHQHNDHLLPQVLDEVKQQQQQQQKQKHADSIKVVPYSMKSFRVTQQRRTLNTKQRLERIYKYGALVETTPGKWIHLVGTERARKAILRGTAKKVQCHHCQTYHLVHRAAQALYCKKCKHLTSPTVTVVDVDVDVNVVATDGVVRK